MKDKFIALLFAKIRFAKIRTSILNEVLNSHLAVVPNFNEDEIVLALNEDNTGLQHYAMGFWKPLPKERPFQKRFYLIQSSAQTESPLVKKQPEIFENLIGKVAQKSDFINVSIFAFKIFRFLGASFFRIFLE